MAGDSASDSRDIRHYLRVLARDTEEHWGLPRGVLGDTPAGALPRGNIMHFPSNLNRAILTAEGGVVACSDANLAADIARTISERVGDDYVALLSQLQAALKQSLPARGNVYVAHSLEQIADRDPGLPAAVCNLYVFLYCDTPTPAKSEIRDAVEMLRPSDVHDQHFLPITEHVCAIRVGSVVAATAWNLPRLKVDDRRFHALGVWTRKPYWGKGFGKAVVSVLVEHIASEHGISGWSWDDVRNVASAKIAHSVGFVEHMWEFKWEVRQAEE